MKFTNENRSRYYGLRVGDIVNAKSPNGTVWGKSKVLELVPMDNNKVIIESKNGTPIEWVAEWCEIVTKVEDIQLLEASKLAKQFIDYAKSANLNLFSDKMQLMYQASASLDDAIKKATEQ